MEWPQNSSRHSFYSYHIAKLNDGHELRNDMGHSHSGLIFSTYRELVSHADGEKYFAIYPPQPASNVVAMA